MGSSSNELINVVRTQSNPFIMRLRIRKLREDILHPNRLPIGININIRPGNMKQSHHLLDPIRNFERVNITRRFKRVTPFCRPPIMLEVMPFTAESCRVDRAGMPMAR